MQKAYPILPDKYIERIFLFKVESKRPGYTNVNSLESFLHIYGTNHVSMYKTQFYVTKMYLL